MEDKGNIIELLLVGQELTQVTLDSVNGLMKNFGIDSTTRLVVHQGLDADQKVDIAQIRTSILEDVFKQNQVRDSITPAATVHADTLPDISKELGVLYPNISAYSISPARVHRLDSSRVDSVLLLIVKLKEVASKKDQQRMTAWVKERMHADSIKLVVE